VGIVAQDLRTMQVRAFRADAVVIATGGCGAIFGKSTNSVMCNGAAASRCYQAGAWYANGEFIQVHPTAIPGADKLRLMSESARGEGGRVWVPRKAGDTRDPRSIPEEDRFYFLEEKYPAYGNIVPRDIATREIFDICVNQGLGIGGGNMVYLDLTHHDRDDLELRLGGILEIYRKFVGEDPAEVPMRIFPGVHYTMGGLWTQYTAKDDLRGLDRGAPNSMMTNIDGLYAFGEVNYQYHGANRLGANALLSCIFDGLFCGDGVARYVLERIKVEAVKLSPALYDDSVGKEEATVEVLVNGRGDENPYQIGREMGEARTASSTVVKSGERLKQATEKLAELRRRAENVRLSDTGLWTNQNLAYARALRDMLKLAEVIVRGGIARTESRGSHYRTDYPERDDVNFLKTTVARYDPETRLPEIRFEPVETGMVPPRARTYGKVETAQKTPAEPATEAAEEIRAS
jgi:succinate dehydrogenase / fumarate reductase flavoprotein subunit